MDVDTPWFLARLKELRISQNDVAREIGRDRTVVTKIINGTVRMGPEHVKGFAQALQVSTSEILYRAGMLDDKTQRFFAALGEPTELSLVNERIIFVPLISWEVVVGITPVTDPATVGPVEGHVPVPYKHDKLIALRVVGDSMNMVAPEGAIVVVDYCDRGLVSGKYYVIVPGDGEPMLRRYRSSPDRFEPVSRDDRFEPLLASEDIKVIGRVRQVITDM